MYATLPRPRHRPGQVDRPGPWTVHVNRGRRSCDHVKRRRCVAPGRSRFKPIHRARKNRSAAELQILGHAGTFPRSLVRTRSAGFGLYRSTKITYGSKKCYDPIVDESRLTRSPPKIGRHFTEPARRLVPSSSVIFCHTKTSAENPAWLLRHRSWEKPPFPHDPCSQSPAAPVPRVGN